MHRTDNRWTTKVTEWQPRNCKRSQGRQKSRWRDEIVALAGVGWRTLTSDRQKWKGLGMAFVLQWRDAFYEGNTVKLRELFFSEIRQAIRMSKGSDMP